MPNTVGRVPGSGVRSYGIAAVGGRRSAPFAALTALRDAPPTANPESTLNQPFFCLDNPDRLRHPDHLDDDHPAKDMLARLAQLARCLGLDCRRESAPSTRF